MFKNHFVPSFFLSFFLCCSHQTAFCAEEKATKAIQPEKVLTENVILYVLCSDHPENKSEMTAFEANFRNQHPGKKSYSLFVHDEKEAADQTIELLKKSPNEKIIRLYWKENREKNKHKEGPDGVIEDFKKKVPNRFFGSPFSSEIQVDYTKKE
jgi:hypothetical protein